MIIQGVIKALFGGDWESEFDLSRQALPRSFIAVALYIALGFVVAQAMVKFNAVIGTVPYGAIAIILTLIAFSFPLIAYILCMVFEKQDRFRSWVIVRNWTYLFALMFIAAVFGLYLIHLLPFSIAYILGLTGYLGTLIIDIRLAMRAGGFDWIGGIFAGILLSVTSMVILMQGLNQAIA